MEAQRLSEVAFERNYPPRPHDSEAAAASSRGAHRNVSNKTRQLESPNSASWRSRSRRSRWRHKSRISRKISPPRALVMWRRSRAHSRRGADDDARRISQISAWGSTRVLPWSSGLSPRPANSIGCVIHCPRSRRREFKVSRIRPQIDAGFQAQHRHIRRGKSDDLLRDLTDTRRRGDGFVAPSVSCARAVRNQLVRRRPFGRRQR